MKVVLLIFSLFFLVSAANDCCLTELEEELTKVSKTTHADDDDDDHSEDSEACEECQCSTFCSYNIITEVSHSNLLLPFSSIQEVCFFSEPVKEKNIPESIFHPPIV